MAYVVTDACTRDFVCVEECATAAIAPHAGDPDAGTVAQVFINPDECIDCGVCEPECPVDAIKPDTEDEPDGKWLKVNTDYAKIWPNITVKGAPPADAEDFEGQTGKFEKFFSEKPGSGS